MKANYLKEQLCPLCHSKVEKSDYLNQIFRDDPQVEWIANLVTHYRHNHIQSWNRCWDGQYGNHYRRNWFTDYESEKSIVNERAKRQIIRKGHSILEANQVTVEHFKRLQGTTDETVKLASKYLSKE